MINKISFKNYKLFKEKQTLELKPITILIGKNNSGKSAVLKLPVMISGSLSGDFDEALQLDYKGVSLGSEFRDLVYNREIKFTDFLDIELSNELYKEKRIELKTKIKLPVKAKEKAEIFGWEYFENNHLLEKKNEDNFKGILKNGNSIKGLNLNIDYIGAFREVPKVNYLYDSKEYENIGLKGENAYPILIQDKEDKRELLDNISNWYKENFENWNLDVKDFETPSGTQYQIVLSNEKLKDINIVYTGQGINQVLPLIVRSYMNDLEPVLITIEEPETHLHPAAHGSLAQRFVDSFIENTNKNYLIETHSENFILRIQRLIADPKVKLTNEDVKIYYVNYDENDFSSSIKEILIDESGEIEEWPDNIFNESYDELVKLKQAQKRREEDDS
ncbi:AAA family ATPase [Flavobacterium macrobrachii]|uniref:AAA family ATPase n=1 Tax=Flavobacterium macrobrachii TaxID=591204 RepID=UPI003F71327E